MKIPLVELTERLVRETKYDLPKNVKSHGMRIGDEGALSFDVFFDHLAKAINWTVVDSEWLDLPKKRMELKAIGKPVEMALYHLGRKFRKASDKGNKVIFIGNGGSSAISSHMAVDYTKNGGVRAVAFNDAPTLTCLANDFGYENVFSKQLEYYAFKGDVVVIISSSGKSANILKAAEFCNKKKIHLVTFSGMREDNELRSMGGMNFYVPAADYGIVELTHASLLHSIVSVPDRDIDWTKF